MKKVLQSSNMKLELRTSLHMQMILTLAPNLFSMCIVHYPFIILQVVRNPYIKLETSIVIAESNHQVLEGTSINFFISH